jgi:hypothetical protein
VDFHHVSMNEPDGTPRQGPRKRHLEAGRIPPAEDHPR